MIYDHMVKVNGKYYQAGEYVPEIEMTEEEIQLPFSDSNIEFETEESKQYTKTDINSMNTAELQELATAEGIKNAYEISGKDLKKILVERFRL